MPRTCAGQGDVHLHYLVAACPVRGVLMLTGDRRTWRIKFTLLTLAQTKPARGLDTDHLKHDTIVHAESLSGRRCAPCEELLGVEIERQALDVPLVLL